MFAELGSVIEGQGPTRARRQAFQDGAEVVGDGLG